MAAPPPTALPRAEVDVLVPTMDRPAALAVTLTGLAAQTVTGFRVVVSDQSQRAPAQASGEVAAAARILRHRGADVDLHQHEPRGLAEQRAHLLGQSGARYVLFLDDDVWLEPIALARLLTAMGRLRCGFVGSAVQGLSYLSDVRPDEQVAYEEWPAGEVRPERVRRGTRAWERWRLHNAANLMHIARDRGLAGMDWRAYKVAWVGGCVLYDRAKLVRCGGFDFWPRLPRSHSGEDVVAQLWVMERYGGAGVIPSGAFHLEVPTTVVHREVECYDVVLAG